MSRNRLNHYGDRKSSLRLLRVLVIVILIVVLLRLCFWPTRVDGHSMEETLYHNDIVVISKIATMTKAYTYDDLIVVEVLDEAGNNEKVVKRIIGLSGDHVVIKEDVLYINGSLVEEPYKKGYMAEDLDYYVPSESYFILGDSRTVSRDSRSFGCIQKNQITEIVLFRLF